MKSLLQALRRLWSRASGICIVAFLVLTRVVPAAAQTDTSHAQMDTSARARTDSSARADSSPRGAIVPAPVDAGPLANRNEQGRVVWLLDDQALLRARMAEVRGTGLELPALRSTSSLYWAPGIQGTAFRILWPEAQLVTNSTLPYSRNDGALWAGRGQSLRILAGGTASLGFLRVIIAPEFVSTENRAFAARREDVIPSPKIPGDRSKFSFPWYVVGPYSIDLPWRMGPKSLRTVKPGQSSVLAQAGPVAFGFATENEWWGPGIDNALVLSNNAPGFPHLVFRNAHPLSSRLGLFSFEWLVGGLRESNFFDTTAANNERSIASAAVTLHPKRAPHLTVGAARSVIGTSDGWRQIPFRWLDVFRNTGHPNERAANDSSLYAGGWDQLYSLFARWYSPADGIEIYGEWGRTDFPKNLRDLLVKTNRGQAYTMGLSWTRSGFAASDLWNVRLENTSVEQSAAFRSGLQGIWYTSRRVIQGYTNEGQALGAAVGPGSSGQVMEINYYLKGASLGVEGGRTRYNEDFHTYMPMLDYLRWCSHDVGLQWGVHGGYHSRFGTFFVRSQFQNRINAWFQAGKGCPRSDLMVDIRNNNLSVTFVPFSNN